jgi:hypothetical protein
MALPRKILAALLLLGGGSMKTLLIVKRERIKAPRY